MTCNCTTDGNNCGCQTNIAEENSIEYYYNQTVCRLGLLKCTPKTIINQ